MNFCWELVCYRLNGRDIGHIFQTCKERNELCKKESFWRFIFERDFPQHPVEISYRLSYQDLYQYGAYYFFKQHADMHIYPSRPVCMFIEETEELSTSKMIGITYHKKGQYRILRLPFDRYLCKFPTTSISKATRKKLLMGQFGPKLRAFVRSDDFICVSAEPFQWDCELVICKPYRSNNEDLLKWIFEHFDVKVAALLPTSYCNIRVIGALKEGNEISFTAMRPKNFKTCGEGGGMNGQCPKPVSGLSFQKTPYYGRCASHPRITSLLSGKIDESIFEEILQTFSGKGMFIFVNNNKSFGINVVSKELDPEIPSNNNFIRMNGQLFPKFG
jgi:hypothetical protein